MVLTAQHLCLGSVEVFEGIQLLIFGVVQGFGLENKLPGNK